MKPLLKLFCAISLFTPAAGAQDFSFPTDVGGGKKTALKFSVVIKREPPVISARTDFELIPKDFQKAYIDIEVLQGGKTETAKTISFDIQSDYDPDLPKVKAGMIVKDKTNPFRWIYVPYKEEKTDRRPKIIRVTITAKCAGIVCSEPITISVRGVFDHLINPHTPAPGLEFNEPQDEDYNTALKYAKWKYDIDTSNLQEISFDSELEMRGVTYAGLLNNTRIAKLGKRAFLNETICASVLGHENIHGGQGRLLFLGQRNKAEPPAYQWEIDNAVRLGHSQDYINELYMWRNDYAARKPDFKILMFF